MAICVDSKRGTASLVEARRLKDNYSSESFAHATTVSLV
jgi:hypothetical protein